MDKKEYVTYYKNLEFYEKMGVKIKKIQKGYCFAINDKHKNYIEYNTKLRAASNSECEQNSYKLANNAIFGKTVENEKDRRYVEIINNKERAAKLARDPRYKNYTAFCENLVAIHKKKTAVKCSKPRCVGFVILELAKLKMYKTYYEYLLPKFGKRIKLLYTDTDSFIIQVNSEDVFKEIAPDVNEQFDTSNFPENHPIGKEFIGKNKKVSGMLKDEAGGKTIKDFAGICSKCYTYKLDIKQEDHGGPISLT